MEIETKKDSLISAVEREDWDECLKLILEFKENSNATKPTS
jgi:hypothetical protein